MRRIVAWLASTVTVVVLLFGYHTSTNKTTGPAVTSSSSSPTTSAGSKSSSPPPSSTSSPTGSNRSSSPSPSTGSGASTAKTVTGSVAQTRWGPVQVQLTVLGGKITKVTVLLQPNGNHKDQEINDQALPVLIQDTLSAQSAKIDMVSGATVTSDGYIESLQSALDKAGI